MTNYELMLVANNERADQLLSRVEKVIKELNAQSLKVERLGKKQLGYSIKKQSDGTYFVLNFEMEADGAKPLSDKLRLEEEDLLRHLLIRVEKKAKKGKGKKAVESKVEEDEKEPPKAKVTVVK